jgi:putative DNA primase/helicase
MSEGGFKVQCGRPDHRGVRVVVAMLGDLSHRDKFDTNSDFHRRKFRETVVSKFSLTDDAHEHVETAILNAADNTDVEAGPVSSAKVFSMASVMEKTTEWFWEGYMPAGSIVILDGDPDQAKSQISLDLAARYSRGDAMPPCSALDDTFPAGNSLLLQFEDDIERTTKPRLLAAGAVVERIHVMRSVELTDGEERPVQLPRDIPTLEQVIRDLKIGYMPIDVLSCVIEEGQSMNEDSDMRRLMSPLSQMAERTQCAILLLRHLNKKENVGAMHRGGGSMAIIGACRAGFAAAPDPNNPDGKVLVCTKMNLARKPASLSYEIESFGDTSRIAWTGQSDVTANQVFGKQGRGSGGGEKVSAAIDIIANALASGPKVESDIMAAITAAGISRSTYWSARKELNVQSEKTGYQGRWLLSLPTSNGNGHEEF